VKELWGAKSRNVANNGNYQGETLERGKQKGDQSAAANCCE
jgi:hypothetical protein